MSVETFTPPGGPDVTRRNPNPANSSYIKGDANTDGSIRFIKVDTGGTQNRFTRIETRSAGAWAVTGLKFSGSSIDIGNLTLSSAGRMIHTQNLAEASLQDSALIPDAPFSDEDGSNFLFVPIVTGAKDVSLYPGPAVSQILSNTITIEDLVGTGRLIDTITHQVGTQAPAAVVLYTIYEGIDNTGPIIFGPKEFGPSLFVINSPIVIDVGKSVLFEEGTAIFIELTTPEGLSLETDSGGNVLTDYNLHDFRTIGGITTNRMVNRDLYPILDRNLNPTYGKLF